MKTIALWTEPQHTQLLSLAQEAMRTALAAVGNPQYAARAKEALVEYQTKLVEVMQPPLVIDMLRMVFDTAKHGGHLQIELPK